MTLSLLVHREVTVTCKSRERPQRNQEASTLIFDVWCPEPREINSCHLSHLACSDGTATQQPPTGDLATFAPTVTYHHPSLSPEWLETTIACALLWPTASPVGQGTENNPVFRCCLPYSDFMVKVMRHSPELPKAACLGVLEGTLLEWRLCGCTCVYLCMCVCLYMWNMVRCAVSPYSLIQMPVCSRKWKPV